MDKVFLTHKDFNEPTIDYVFNSTFYTEKCGKVVEVKIDYISWRKEVDAFNNVANKVVVIYRTPFGEERFSDYTLNKFPVFRTPALVASERAFTEYQIKIMSCEVSKNVGLRHYDTGRAVFGLGTSVIYHEVVNGKVVKNRAILVGMDFMRDKPVLFYFADGVSAAATCGNWGEEDKWKLENYAVHIMYSHDEISRLCVTQQQAEQILLESGCVVRFSDTPNASKTYDNLKGITNTLKELSFRMGFEVSVEFKPLD